MTKDELAIEVTLDTLFAAGTAICNRKRIMHEGNERKPLRAWRKSAVEDAVLKMERAIREYRKVVG